jgi:hypothetical protein
MADSQSNPPKERRRIIPQNEAINDVSALEMDRFWRFVVKQDGDGCWVWSGSKSKGYGFFGFRGRNIKAHRFIWRVVNGAVPTDLELDHICNNRSCIRLSHLRLSTARANVLRGGSVIAANALKTHCLRGHEFNEENTLISPKNYRRCRACNRERMYRKDTGHERPMEWSGPKNGGPRRVTRSRITN